MAATTSGGMECFTILHTAELEYVRPVERRLDIDARSAIYLHMQLGLPEAPTRTLRLNTAQRFGRQRSVVARAAPSLQALGRASLLGLALFGAGCSDRASDPEPRGAIILTDANNYRSQSTLDVPRVEVASDVDLDICWSDLEEDLQCHEVDAASDVNNVNLLRFVGLSELEVEQKLTSGQLSMASVNGFSEYNTAPGASCAKLSQLNFFGTPIEIEHEFQPGDDQIFMLLFTKGTVPGVGARSLLFVTPDDAGTATSVSAPDACGMLEFSADLRTLSPVSVPPSGPFSIDWRDITRDGAGHALRLSGIDGLLLAFYEGVDLAYLEDNIFDIQQIASEIWELELDGQATAELEASVSRSTGLAFEGFAREAEGVWLLGLMCSTCSNPAPVLLTVLEPEPLG